MSIGFHPILFDASRFESLHNGDIYRRVQASILPGNHFSCEIRGYDIISFRVEENPYRPVGSLVDFLLDHLPKEAQTYLELPEVLALLEKLTDRHGILAEETDHIFLGYLTKEEVTVLRRRLSESPIATPRTLKEKTALEGILTVAEEHNAGLLYSQS